MKKTLTKPAITIVGLMVFQKMYNWWKSGRKEDVVIEEDQFKACFEERFNVCLETLYQNDPYSLRMYKCGEWAKSMCTTPVIEQPTEPVYIEKPTPGEPYTPPEPVGPTTPVIIETPEYPIIIIPPETQPPPVAKKKISIFG